MTYRLQKHFHVFLIVECIVLINEVSSTNSEAEDTLGSQIRPKKTWEEDQKWYPLNSMERQIKPSYT